jgi:hypothetical protein
LNRGWIDTTEETIPTYDEIVGPDPEVKEEEETKEEEVNHPWGVLDEDEFDEQAEEFETAYNFRFEEPYVPMSYSHLPTSETDLNVQWSGEYLDSPSSYTHPSSPP